MTISFDALCELVRGAVSTLPAEKSLSESDGLTALGIDSITTLNIVMEAGERFELDLERLDEDTPPPTTLGELRQLLIDLSPVTSAA
ncbi:MAG: phosphopantetheine-binding protein [Azospirillaceae bacterium]